MSNSEMSEFFCLGNLGFSSDIGVFPSLAYCPYCPIIVCRRVKKLITVGLLALFGVESFALAGRDSFIIANRGESPSCAIVIGADAAEAENAPQENCRHSCAG